MFGINLEGFSTVMVALGLVVGVMGAFAVFFLFMPKKNQGRYNPKVNKLYDFLHFRFYMIQWILKFAYVVMACVCTAVGTFLIISIVEIARGMLLLVVGNLLIRIAYEFLLMLVLACEDLGEINRNMKTLKGEPAVRTETVESLFKKEAGGQETEVQEIKTQEAEGSKEAAASEELAMSQESAAQECYCSQCGSKCSTEHKYCNICGVKLHKE